MQRGERGVVETRGPSWCSLRSRLSRCPDWGPCRAPCHAELSAIALAPRCTWRSPRVRDRVVFGFASMAFSAARLSHGDPPAAARRFLVCRAPLPPTNSCEPHRTLAESRQVSLLPLVGEHASEGKGRDVSPSPDLLPCRPARRRSWGLRLGTSNDPER